MWKCPKCNREFHNKNQSHSCNKYPIEKHFENRENVRKLFDYFASKVKEFADFHLDSVSCCIRFVTTHAFAGAIIMKDKMRVHFQLDHKIESKRIWKSAQISAKRFTYRVDVHNEEEIDDELLNWIKLAYSVK